MNKEHLKLLPPEKIASEIYTIVKTFYDTDAEYVRKLSPMILDRISSFGDISAIIEAGELDFFQKTGLRKKLFEMEGGL